MKKNNVFVLLLFFLTHFAFSQKVEKLFFAKVVTDSTLVSNVNIINVSTEKTTVSDKNGMFQILVKVGDILVLTAVNLESRKKTIEEDDLKTEVVILKMKLKITPLKEVIVNENNDVNAEKLRIIPHGQKEYTPAERKLYTARSGILDPLLNKISGRTAMLKREVQVERNEKLLLKLDGFYEENYYTNVLKIPKEYIKGFQYYLIEDVDFSRALQAKNKTLTMFFVKRLAVNYNDIIRLEEK